MSHKPHQTVLLAERDVIVRLTIAEYLRGCGHKVLEAATSEDAKAILQSGLTIEVLFSDAELAGADSGFALAHWVRRYRPGVEVILTSSVASKAQAASEFCSRWAEHGAPSDAPNLGARIRALLAERKRRARPPSSNALSRLRRKLS